MFDNLNVESVALGGVLGGILGLFLASNANNQHPAVPAVDPRLIILHYQDTSIACFPPTSYYELVHKARTLFKFCSDQELKALAMFNGVKAEIDPQTYPYIQHKIDKIWIKKVAGEQQRLLPRGTVPVYNAGTFDPSQMLVKKPVIYLYPPQSMEVSVNLSLVQQWSFFALYPLAPVKRITGESVGESIRWDVMAAPDGNLLDKNSGSEVAYLFWEAEAGTNAIDTPPASRPGSPALTALAFDPSRPTVSPSDSVIFPVESIPKYLDESLLSLGLHTEARTSFITYWLPSILKHKNVALRFLNQAEYSAAAPLDITPKPDVIIRVFMLFRGIPSDELELWDSACDVSADKWRDVVGVSLEGMCDRGKFRVLEWGGMEVLRLHA